MNPSYDQNNLMLTSDLEQSIRHTYQLLTSSRYVTNRHLEQLVIDVKNKVGKLENKKQWQGYMRYMRGVALLYIQENSVEFERRYHYFCKAIVALLSELYESLDTEERQSFIDYLADLAAADAAFSAAPWPSLLNQAASKMNADEIARLYTFLSTSVDADSCSKPLALSFSFIALLADKEVTALVILMKSPFTFEEFELENHFRILKERTRWNTMKHWMIQLFPKRDQHHFGSLQPYIDEMNAAISTSPSEQIKVWERWLRAPSYERFLTYTQSMPANEIEKLLARLLPQLKERIESQEAAKTYEQLLIAFEKYDLATEYLFLHVREPNGMSKEKQHLLHTLKQKQPALAKQVYHQLIIRQIEKKSRVHYEEAAQHLKTLHTLYAKLDESHLFNDYYQKLKNLYRTYRAFIEELRRNEF